MTIIYLYDSCYLAIINFNGAIYSATSDTRKAAHVAVINQLIRG